MTKQKIQTLFLSALPFGTSVSFWLCFSEKTGNMLSAAILVLGGFLTVVCSFLFKLHRGVLEAAVKMQPLAAVVFTASFILSFLPYSMMWPQLFAVLVLNAVCLSMAFENLNKFSRGLFFSLICIGGLTGIGCALLVRGSFVYICFIVLSLLFRPEQNRKTAQDVWKDIAFPLFVLVGSFLLFIAANHNAAFPSVIAESVVMLMTGALLMTSSSSLRLTLMTIVMMIFGSYVFSAQNAESVFNRSVRGAVQVQVQADRRI
ncbi:MAG: hypothetical protein IJ752_06700 [Alphaproteobacteria bacterium]|nr:hypothetical protein [Alphaproteobacteria bacterium]